MVQTAKQRAASKRNIKKAQAARRKKFKKTKKKKKKVKHVAKKKGKKKGSKKRKTTKRRGKKNVQRGILGRIGATLMGVGPPLVAGLDAGAAAMGVAKTEDLNMLSTIDFGFRRFINNLTNGIVGKEAFSAGVGFSKKDGSRVRVNVANGVEAGSLLLVIGTGATMMLVDYAMSYLTGNRAVKVLGTNITATGTR